MKEPANRRLCFLKTWFSNERISVAKARNAVLWISSVPQRLNASLQLTVQLGGWKLEEVGPRGGLPVAGAVPLEGMMRPQSLLLLSFLHPSHGVSGSVAPHSPTMMCCLHSGPKATGSINHGLTPLKLWASNNLFSVCIDNFRYCWQGWKAITNVETENGNTYDFKVRAHLLPKSKGGELTLVVHFTCIDPKCSRLWGNGWRPLKLAYFQESGVLTHEGLLKHVSPILNLILPGRGSFLSGVYLSFYLDLTKRMLDQFTKTGPVLPTPLSPQRTLV